MIDGFRIYYNFIRPHQGLNGMTPAEKANLNLNLGQNKWLSLIKQSAQGREGKKSLMFSQFAQKKSEIIALG